MSQIVIDYKKHSSNKLSELSKHYSSDKGSPIENEMHRSVWKFHNYTDFYDLIFSQKRGDIKNLLEAGIGTNNPRVLSSMGVHGVPGASLRMWRDYFPNAEIVGIDIDPDILFSEDRIETYAVDQTNANDFMYSMKRIYDVIVDDGLHTAPAQIDFFKSAFPYLAPDGVYIIEDTIKSNDEVKEFLDSINANYMCLTFVREGEMVTEPWCSKAIVIRN